MRMKKAHASNYSVPYIGPAGRGRCWDGCRQRRVFVHSHHHIHIHVLGFIREGGCTHQISVDTWYAHAIHNMFTTGCGVKARAAVLRRHHQIR